MPLISIVLPVFNRELLIKRTIENLLLQTFTQFEIIAVDDNSTDQTYHELQSLAKKDSRIRYIKSRNNQGAQATRNLGILESRGQWIAFQDSDDLWMPEKLARQVSELEKTNFDPLVVVHSDCVIHDFKKKRETTLHLPKTDGKNVLLQLLQAPSVMFPAILTSKTALERIGYLDERVSAYQEWDTAIRLAQLCSFIHIQEPLFIYNIHPGSTVSKSGEQTANGYQYIIEKFHDEIMNQCGAAAWDNHIRVLLEISLNFGLWQKADLCLEKLSLTNAEINKIYRDKIYGFLRTEQWHHVHFLRDRILQTKKLKSKDKFELNLLGILSDLHFNPDFILRVIKKIRSF